MEVADEEEADVQAPEEKDEDVEQEQGEEEEEEVVGGDKDIGAASSDAEWLVSMLDYCRRWASLPPISVEPQRLLEYVKENW